MKQDYPIFMPESVRSFIRHALEIKKEPGKGCLYDRMGILFDERMKEAYEALEKENFTNEQYAAFITVALLQEATLDGIETKAAQKELKKVLVRAITGSQELVDSLRAVQKGIGPEVYNYLSVIPLLKKSDWHEPENLDAWEHPIDLQVILKTATKELEALLRYTNSTLSGRGNKYGNAIRGFWGILRITKPFADTLDISLNVNIKTAVAVILTVLSSELGDDKVFLEEDIRNALRSAQ